MLSKCPLNFGSIYKSVLGDSIIFMCRSKEGSYWDNPIYYTLSYLRENKRMLVSSIYNLADFKYKYVRYCYA